MIRVDVDLANPGQFFACCGLFELAHRLWPDTTGHFEGASLVLSQGDLQRLIERAAAAPLVSLVESDRAASPIELSVPFGLRLDWWKDVRGGGREIKTWAGSMRGPRIAEAMRSFLSRAFAADSPFDYGVIVTDDAGTKVEPFYFDARRSGTASALDTGFSANDLKHVAILSFPAVEFFTLVGLQRFRPRREGVANYFYAWSEPLPITIAALVACGGIERPSARWRYSTPFHTKYAKSFSPAVFANGDQND
jgi:CRISPR-associated protein Csb3